MAGAKPTDVPGFTKWLGIVSPELSWNWNYQVYVRQHLAALTRREINRLYIAVPPQHGKTTMAVRYTMWRAIRRGGTRIAITGYNQNYANRLSRMAKRVAVSAGQELGDQKAVNEWTFMNGSTVYAVGVGGGLTGRPVDFAYLDDVVKSRVEADSEAYRERAWEWYLDDFQTRLQKDSQVLAVNTRWHQDDLFGRIQREEGHKWRIVNLPAIAIEDDPLGREIGEALCPERYPIDILLEKKSALGEGFESLYQGNPVPRGGAFFRRDWFQYASHVPDDALVDISRVRYWDTAASIKDSACYTAGVLMARGGGRIWIEDVIRGRWQPAERNTIIVETAKLDSQLPGFRKTYFEHGAGDAGIESAQRLLDQLTGYSAEADRPSGSKEERANPLADKFREGLVRVLQRNWTSDFVGELCAFPRGAFKDQTDSASGAYIKLSTPEPYIGISRVKR